MSQFAFQIPADIGNRAAQHCGQQRMGSLGFNEISKVAQETGSVYEKLKAAELERNVWTFATRKCVLRPIDTNTMLLMPTLWSSGTTYFLGALVVDQFGAIWESLIPSNFNNNPLNQPNSQWGLYFGPLTVMAYDSTTTYFSGELVYTAPGDGTYNVFRSLMNSNALDPSLPNQWSKQTIYMRNNVVMVYPAYSAVTTYAAGQTVVDVNGNTFSSLVAGNLNNTPAISPAQWAQMPVVIIASLPVPSATPLSPASTSPIVEWRIGNVYNLGNFVLFNGSTYVSIVNNNSGLKPNVNPASWAPVILGVPYMSLVDLNLGNSPSTSPAQWTTAFVGGSGNQQWLQVGGAASAMGVALAELGTAILWPLGTGPATQSATRNIFLKPAGFLREAPQDPRAGSTSFLGAPTGLAYTDWEYAGNYIVSREVNPIPYRFVANVADVTQFHAMFCEGLGARIGIEVCKPLTQSTEKVKDIREEYEKFMTEARTVNAIEAGADEPPEDDWLTCRI